MTKVKRARMPIEQAIREMVDRGLVVDEAVARMILEQEIVRDGGSVDRSRPDDTGMGKDRNGSQR